LLSAIRRKFSENRWAQKKSTFGLNFLLKIFIIVNRIAHYLHGILIGSWRFSKKLRRDDVDSIVKKISVVMLKQENLCFTIKVAKNSLRSKHFLKFDVKPQFRAGNIKKTKKNDISQINFLSFLYEKILYFGHFSNKKYLTNSTKFLTIGKEQSLCDIYW